jgi:ribosomal protein S18 acetylase RimI-like enzyme
MDHRSYWLELGSPTDFRPTSFPAGISVTIVRARAADHPLCRRLWQGVGQGFWTEREDWDESAWIRHLDQKPVVFGLARSSSAEIGFFELFHEGTAIKLEGFGLLPAWRARGLGAGLLTAATEQAFALGAQRVWLHTATDDHPHALPNYLKRGYRVTREEPLRDPVAPLKAP